MICITGNHQLNNNRSAGSSQYSFFVILDIVKKIIIVKNTLLIISSIEYVDIGTIIAYNKSTKNHTIFNTEMRC